MEDLNIRIQKIAFDNLKNVTHGVIPFACSLRENVFEPGSDVLGIYGQNGSGKTTLIYTLEMIRTLLMGNCLKEDCGNYIKTDAEVAKCSVEFSMKTELEKCYLIFYDFEIRHDEEDEAYVSMEKISIATVTNGQWTKPTTLLSYNELDKTPLLPKTRYMQLTNGERKISDELRVLKILIKKSHCSFLFSKELFRL